MTEVALPPGLIYVRTTREFSETTVPPALLSAHRVAPSTWGNLVVRTGSIDFTFEGDPAFEGHSTRSVHAGESQPIPPDRPHHLSVTGPTQFVIEFFRIPGDTAEDGP